MDRHIFFLFKNYYYNFINAKLKMMVKPMDKIKDKIKDMHNFYKCDYNSN